MSRTPPHALKEGWKIEVADRGDGAHVATITLRGQMMCRVTRSSSTEEASHAKAQLHAERWIDEYIERGKPQTADHGIVERLSPTAAARSTSSMPLDYLRKIQYAELPLRIEDPKEIDCVAVLLAAQLVEASISNPAGRPADDQTEFAIVERITLLGRIALGRKPP